MDVIWLTKAFRIVIGISMAAVSLASRVPAHAADSQTVGPNEGFFSSSAPPAGAQNARPPSLRERYVTVDFVSLQTALAAGSGVIRFELFPDAVVEVATESVEVQDDGLWWLGRGSAGGNDQIASITLTLSPTPSVAATFWSGSQVFTLSLAGGATYAIGELDQVALIREEAGGTLPSVPAGTGTAPPKASSPSASSDAEAAVSAQAQYAGYVDVLAVYSQAAAGAVSNIQTVIQNRLNEANNSNNTSGIPFRFRLVRSEQVNFNENADNIDDDLRLLSGTADNVLDGVHATRDNFAADLVVLFGRGYSTTNQEGSVPPTASCGVGYQMATPSLAFASSAFSVVDIAGPCRVQAMAHEMGHNMALRHDWANSNGNGSAYPDNHGHVSVAGDFMTVMAYNSTACPGGTCTPVSIWSDPDVRYNGQPAGVRDNGVTPVPANNARVIEDTVQWVKDFRNNPNPFGSLDLVHRAPGGIRAAGWAIDPNYTGPIAVHIYVDGVFATDTLANGYRSDIASLYPGFGGNHGFDVSFPYGIGGTHTVCAYGINLGPGTGNPLLGCKQVTVTFNPFGFFDSIGRTPGGARVYGWTIDPDTASPIQVHVYVDGVFATNQDASATRTDVGGYYPEYGNNHGYSFIVSMGPGTHTACVYAINVGPADNASPNTTLGCKQITIDPNPFGKFESATRAAPALISVRGWAIDPDTADPITVRIQVGTLPATTTTANKDRSDVGADYPEYGPKHGFNATVPSSTGTQTVCITAINENGTAGANRSLGCKTVA